MTKLSWGDPGDRLYENGVDRGVLYVDDQGYAWNGLLSVEEKSSGGEVRDLFIDGVKYAEVTGVENFEGTIEALSSPDAFADCDGSGQVIPGLYATHQIRKYFGMSYRTMVGNDVDGQNHGYKIHVLYNVRAGDSERKNETINSNDPIAFSWPITTIPVEHAGIRPTAHFVIDSTEIAADILLVLENTLYGTSTSDPYLPSFEDLVALIATGPTFSVVDNGDGTFDMTGNSSMFTVIDATTIDVSVDSAAISVVDANTYDLSSY